MEANLTNAQIDSNGLSRYAVFLPATSSFYATFIGKQRYANYVNPSRLPSTFVNGVESLNYLDPDKGLFYYKWALYSAGHAKLDLNKFEDSEDMFRNRNRSTSIVVGDSGGFQIGKGVWAANWKDPACPIAQKKREQVLTWMDGLMDYGMCLDIPAWVSRSPAGQQATGIQSYEDAVYGTSINNEWFINNRNGHCKFLNVLQGETHDEADRWYDSMKKYCDTKIYGDRAFNGWAMGGQNMCDIHLTLKRIVTLMYDGLLEKGQHDWMHFLGTSKLEWALLLTDIQRAVRKYHNSNFTISFDCASPFLATANGQIYVQTEIENGKKWIYRMLPSIDDKKYAVDNRLFQDAVVQDGHFKSFTTSPVMDNVLVKDICIYKDGIKKPPKELVDSSGNLINFDWTNPDHYTVVPDVNKMGKIGRTSWDSFTYAIMMGHNVWQHINSVQEANRQYDAGLYPEMLIANKLTGRRFTHFKHWYFKEIVEDIFSAGSKSRAEKIIEDYNRYWMMIVGTRGAVGKKTLNSKTKFSELFIEQSTHNEEFNDEEILKLDELENNIGD